MNQKAKKIEFRLGTAGKLAPLVVAAAMIGWAAFSQSNVNGYVLAFFAALVTGVVFAKDEKAYGEALVYGLGKPMFAIIVLAVILAAVSGKLISASGAVQTIAVYVVEAGFTGKLFVAASFLITCLLAFATGTSVGTYFVVIPILFPVGVLAGAAPEFMIGAIVSGAAFGDNLGPISDTTIASSATQHADLGTVVKTRTRYSLRGLWCFFCCFPKPRTGMLRLRLRAGRLSRSVLSCWWCRWSLSSFVCCGSTLLRSCPSGFWRELPRGCFPAFTRRRD